MTESGDTEIFTVVLNSQPTENVVLNISSENTKETKVSESILVLRIPIGIFHKKLLSLVLTMKRSILQLVVKF